MYYSYGESAKAVRYVDGVLNVITDPGDYICFPESLLDEVLPKLIKAGRGVLTCDMIEKEPEPEDYPPEPYNESECSKVNSHGETPGQKYPEKVGIYCTLYCKTDIYSMDENRHTNLQKNAICKQLGQLLPYVARLFASKSISD